MTTRSAVTGAFSYTGKYITRLLLEQRQHVITLTSRKDDQNLFDGQVQAYPFQFDNPKALAETLRGVDTLYNTYWVRFDHGKATFNNAVENTRTLIRAAKVAGVRRFVHVSISNPTLESPLPYFSGKAQLEENLKASGLSYAILRPTVIFGDEDILINNIAYLLRRFPLFAIPGAGEYQLQPIFVEDMAQLAVDAGHREENLTWDAVGPEIYTFNELVQLTRSVVGSRAGLINLPPSMVLQLSRLIGFVVGDVVLTEEEIQGLMANLLISAEPPTGKTSLRAWLRANANHVGSRYASELKRHYNAQNR